MSDPLLRVPNTRCCECGHELEVTPEMNLRCCPACGSDAVPTNPQLERDWTLTRWSWRTLCSGALFMAIIQQHSGMRRTAALLWNRVMGEDGNVDAAAVLAAMEERYLHGVEMNEDVTVRLTPHEIRLLTIWSSQLVSSAPEGKAPITDSDIEPVLHALRKQMAPEPFPLTLMEEIGELREAGYKVQLVEGVPGGPQ